MANQVRDNFGRFQKQATIRIAKQLDQLAKDVETNVKKDVAEKLEQCYKENVEQSYMVRSVGAAQDIYHNKLAKEAEASDRKQGVIARHRRARAPYEHTGKFLESIYVVIDGNKVQVRQRELTYPSYSGKKRDVTTSDVYEWLTKGTNGGGHYRFRNTSGYSKTAYNYPTPRHEFEEHTMVQMLGYLESLKNQLRSKKQIRMVYKKFKL